MAAPQIDNKRILFLTPQLPYPPEQGTAIRNYNLLVNVARRREVALLSFASSPHADPGPLATLCAHLRTVAAPVRSPADRLRTLLTTPDPDMAARLYAEPFANALREMVTQWPCDMVQVEGIELAPYALWLKAQLGERCPAIVFDDHNAEYVMQHRACATDALRPRRWPAALYSLVQWRRLARYERRICRAASAVVCVSEADAQALRRLVPGMTPTVVPNGVDVQRYRPGLPDSLPLRHPALVYTGKMDYRPNIDAVSWFCQAVLPLVRASAPEVTLYVVGKDPPARVVALGRAPDVVVTGYVPDILPYFGGADVYVAPLRVGGGTRLKVLEALAAGIPLVSTHLGAEGIALVGGQHALLADSARAFAEAVLRLIQDADLRARLALAARQFVTEHYDWQRIAPLMESVYDHL